MSLISCLRKIKFFDLEEEKYILAKSKALQEKGMSQEEADIAIVTKLQNDLIKSLKDIHKQLEISSTKQVRKSSKVGENLKPMRIVYRKGPITLEQEEYDNLTKNEKEEYREVVKPAQVMITWDFKDKSGKKLDINNFLTEEGLLDLAKVPKDILTQFGFRIPCQGHRSMSLLEVVGFLPEVMGHVIFTPKNFVTQMGSDFDVDKLYVYDYHLEEVNGKLQKIDNLQTKIVDIHKTVLRNPAVFNQVVKPVDSGKLKYKDSNGKERGIGVELKLLNQKTITDYLSPDYSKSKYLQSIDSKQMVGIEAISTTFAALMQGKNLSLSKPIINDEGKVRWIPDHIVFGTDDGKTLKLTDLSDPFTHTGRTKNEVNSAYLSTTVDDEKDPLLAYLNSNPITAAVQTLLRDLGMEEELSLFIAQPALVEFVRRVRNSKGSLATSRIDQDTLLFDLIDEYTEKIKETPIEYEPDDNLADYPLRPKDFRQVLHGLVEDQLTNDQIQYLTLVKFAKIKTFADPFSRAQGLINIESKGIGRTLIHVADKVASIGGISKIKNIKNLPDVLGEFSETGFIPNTLSGYAINYALLAANTTINTGELLPYSIENINNLFTQLENVIGYKPTTDDKIAFWKGIKGFIYGNHFTQEEREKLFFDREKNQSLNTRIRKLRNNKLKNNEFILRLDTSQVDKSGKKPSYIFYNAAKEENIEELNVYQALIDLVNSKDEELASIGKDLVTYFFINGGDQQAKEWGKYINAKFLDKLNITDYLKSINFSDPKIFGYVTGPASTTVSPVVMQYLQHNPFLLSSPKKESYDKIKFEGKVIADSKYITLPHPAEGLVRELNQTGLGYPPLFSISGSKIALSKLGIFLFDEITEEGVRYIRVPNLGTKFYQEYQKIGEGNVVSSLLDKSFTVDKNIIPNFEQQGIEDLINPTGEETNPKLESDFAPLINTTLGEALRHVNIGAHNQVLAHLFLQLEDVIGKIPVKESRHNENTAGGYNTRTKEITLNPDNIEPTKEAYEITLLKEAVHAVVDGINSGKFHPTVKQREAMTALENLYNNVRTKVLNGELEDLWKSEDLKKFDIIYTKLRLDPKASLTPEERTFFNQNSNSYYGISAVIDKDGNPMVPSWEDFVHEALLQPEFSEKLNQIRLDEKKTVFQRFGALIKDLIEEWRKFFNISSESAMEEAVTNVLKIIEKPDKGEKTKKKPTTGELFAMASNKNQKETETNYTRIVNDFTSRLKLIDTNITNAFQRGDKELGTRLIERRKQVKKELIELIKTNSFNGIVKQANLDLNFVKGILAQEKISTEDIRYSNKVLATWKNITKPEYGIVDESDRTSQTKRYEDSRLIADKAVRLSEILSDIETGTLHKEVQRAIPEKEITKEDLLAVKDISSVQAQFRDISTSDNVVLSVASKWIRRANFDMKTDANKLIAKVDKIIEQLHKNSLFKNIGYEGIYGQVGTDGKLTGEMVEALNTEYFETRDKLLDNAEHAPFGKFRAQAWQKYYNWIKENHIIVDIRKLYKEDSNGLFTYSPNENYLAEVTNQLGEDATKVLKQSKENIEKYNQELQLQIDSHKGIPDGFRIIEEWRATNSPIIYLTNLFEGYKKQEIGGKQIYNKGYNYVTRRALSKWEDEKYNTIQQQPELKEFYNFMVDTMSELRSYLPYSYWDEISSTSIPSINKNLIEKLRDQGVGAGMGLVWSKFLENLTVTDDNTETGITDPETGKIEKGFKIKYLKQINPEDKSYDLGKVIKIFAIEVLEYRHKALVEDNIRLAESVLKKALEKQFSATGEVITDKFGYTNTTKGLRNLYDQFDHALEVFYDNSRDREGVSKKSVITPEGKKKIEREIQEAKDKGLEGAQLEAVIRIITRNNTRYYSVATIGNTFLQYIQIKGMGWNVFGGLNNLSFGFISNHNWAAGERDFTQKELLAATGIMLSYNKEVVGKTAALMTKFDTVKQLNEVAFEPTTDNNKVRKGIEKLAPYELYRKGEYFVQGQTMIAMMKFKKIKVKLKSTGEEIEVSLYDAMDNDGKFNTDLYQADPKWQEKGEGLYDFKDHLDQVVKSIHGNYDPNSPVLIKRKILGRALLQFRSWVAEGIAVRFDAEKYDLMMHRTRKGRFRTLGELGFAGSLKTLAKQMIYFNADKSFDELDKLNLTEDQKKTAIENMKRNLNELYQKATLTALYLVLSGLDIDKDDWKTRIARNYTVNSLMRLSDDIEFYFSPIAFENITRSAIPAFTVIADGNNLVNGIWDTIQGEGEYKSGTHSGESKILYRSAKVLPFGSAVASLINKAKMQETFRK